MYLVIVDFEENLVTAIFLCSNQITENKAFWVSITDWGSDNGTVGLRTRLKD